MSLFNGPKWNQWLVQAREEEQRKITQDLNDYVLQALVDIDRQLSDIQTRSDGPDDVSLVHLQSQLHNVLDMTRSICTDLQPYSVYGSGFVATMQAWLSLLERRGVFHITLATEGDLEQLPQEIVLGLLQILQEALANTQKHAAANHVAIQVRMRDNQVRLVVDDDGRGFQVPQDLETLPSQHRFGLIGMYEGVERLRGELRITSTLNVGTSVQVSIPYLQPASGSTPGQTSPRYAYRKTDQRHPLNIPDVASTRVLIADDHPIIRAGIRNELMRHADIDILGETATSDDTLRCVEMLNPDVVLLDISMPGMPCGSLIPQLFALPKPPIILIMTAHNALDYVLAMLKAGVTGYLLKDEDLAAIPSAVRTVARGGTWISSSIMPLLVGHSTHEQRPSAEPQFSAREAEVLPLLIAGKSNQEIGRELRISERTVRFHLRNIYDKLHMRRGEVIAWGVQRGFGAGDSVTAEMLVMEMG